MKPEIKTVHQRVCRVNISKNELERMVQDHAMSLVGFLPIATKVVIKFEDDREGGSLPYKTGTKCVVDLIEDQDMLPQPDYHALARRISAVKRDEPNYP